MMDGINDDGSSRDSSLSLAIEPHSNVKEEQSLQESSNLSTFLALSNEEKNEIAQKETKAIGRIKTVVALVLIASIAGVGCAVYFFTRGNEKSKFENRFQDDSAKVRKTDTKALALKISQSKKMPGSAAKLCILFLSIFFLRRSWRLSAPPST